MLVATAGQPQAISSGVSFPSEAGTVSSLVPSMRSAEPHSSVLMCADSAQMTASCLPSSRPSPSTLAPLPFSTR